MSNVNLKVVNLEIEILKRKIEYLKDYLAILLAEKQERERLAKAKNLFGIRKIKPGSLADIENSKKIWQLDREIEAKNQHLDNLNEHMKEYKEL